MPFISKEEVKKRRTMLRKLFPDYKFSVRGDYSSIYVTVKEGPLDLLNGLENGYESVNHFWYKSHYKNSPKKLEFIDKIVKIINEGNGIESVDGDYGNIPNFYVNLRIGDWDSPYVCKS